MKQLMVSIPEPCHENWDNMSPTEKGRFCNACSKEVVDFSTMSDAQMVLYFSKLTTEKVCGRVYPDQLDRVMAEPEPIKKKKWYWSYFTLFLLFFSKSSQTKAQGMVMRNTTTQTDNKANLSEIAKVIKGRVVDKNGNAIPFASIDIKGALYATSADVNGNYTKKVRVGDVLLISGGKNYLPKKVIVAEASNIITVLELSGKVEQPKEVIPVAGGVSYRSTYNDATVPVSDHVATLIVKDDKTNQPIINASIIIKNYDDTRTETVLTDKNGKHKIKKIKSDETYFIKVSAEGYNNSEFTMSETDFEGKRTSKEVYLTKKEVPREAQVRLGSIHYTKPAEKILYVLDGNIISNANDINTDDIENISVLQAPAAIALYGSIASNGAIIMTTKKPVSYKILDTVKVTGDFSYKRHVSGAMVFTTTLYCKTSGLRIYPKKENKEENNIEKPSTIKLYPNPIRKGDAVTLSLKLKQAGNYTLKVTSVAGAVLLERKFNAASKEQLQVIESDSRWSSGVYYVWVLDETNKLTNSSSFIVQ